VLLVVLGIIQFPLQLPAGKDEEEEDGKSIFATFTTLTDG
jgi:hypothetical protein